MSSDESQVDLNIRSSFGTIYGTEQEISSVLTGILRSLGYEYMPDIETISSLKNNLRKQLEILNSRIQGWDFQFSDEEWNNFYKSVFSENLNSNYKIKNEQIHGEHVTQKLRRGNKSINVHLIDREKIDNNHLQVISNFEDPYSEQRYDLIILVNGLPLVLFELTSARDEFNSSFNQVCKYAKEGLKGLLEYIQMFIISNDEDTLYFSNSNIRNPKLTSFNNASRWATEDNLWVKHLTGNFAAEFLPKDKLLSQLITFSVLDSESNLIILRSYQISAIKAIINKIKRSVRENIDNNRSGGYVWHATGSGKTLTAFKTAQLLLKERDISKVVFVVDRKDLDEQTSEEFVNFSGGSKSQRSFVVRTESQTHLGKLLNKEGKDDYVILTTIQKMGKLFGDQEFILKPSVRKERIVVIMDECHRTQSRNVHERIKGEYDKINIFGFTGTPLLEKNLHDKRKPTEELFGELMHDYTIRDALKDNRILKFKVTTQQVTGNNEDDRMSNVVEEIIKHEDSYLDPNWLGKIVRRNRKFSSLFTVSSIKKAADYYEIFQEKLKNSDTNLKVAVIFSANSDSKPKEEQKDDSSNKLSEDQAKSLEQAWKQYGDRAGYKIKDFDDYRQKITKALKQPEKLQEEQKIDILIVVRMFLTGFDSKTINTLWVDKHLEGHDLIQSFSRTNRIFNGTKRYGNIHCFVDLTEELDQALRDFSNNVHDSKEIIFDIQEAIDRGLRNEELLMREFPLDRELKTEEEKTNFLNALKDVIESRQELDGIRVWEQNKKIDDESMKKYRDIMTSIINEREFKAEIDKAYRNQIPIGTELIQQKIVDWLYITNLLRELARTKSKKEKKELEERIIESMRGDPELFNKIDLVKAFIEEMKEREDYVDPEIFVREQLMKNIEEVNAKFEGILDTQKVYKLIKRNVQARSEVIIFGGGNAIMDLISQDKKNKYKSFRGTIRREIENELRRIFRTFKKVNLGDD